jgi:tetratricopeptide (TPR) repeat protein
LIDGLPGQLVAGDEWRQLLPILELVGNKQYPEAIASYEKYLQQAPKVLRGPVQFEIATMHSALGNTQRALVVLEQAIQSGFDNCISIQQDADLKPIRNDPRFQALYSRVRISEADLKELYWLTSEMQNISHDTKMMITENMSRVDGGSTVVSRSVIPIRETTSPGVLFYREVVKVSQQKQKEYVLQADQLRIRHLTNMTIISGGSSSEQAARSASLAERAAAERKRAIDARGFVLPPGAGATPRPCGEWK